MVRHGGFRRSRATPGAADFVPGQIFGNSGVGILRRSGNVNLDFNFANDFALPLSRRCGRDVQAHSLVRFSVVLA
jgi:hypothetical protein